MPSTALQDKPLNTALIHAGKVGGGWLALTFLARQLVDMAQSKEREKVDKKLKAYVNAKYPVLTPDPSTRDTKREEQLLASGAAGNEVMPELEAKEAGFFSKEEPKVPEVSKLRSFLEQFLIPMPSNPSEPATIGNYARSAFSSDKYHPGHTALAAAAMLAGGFGGYSLAEKAITKKREKELDERVSNSRNKMDKLLYEEYNRTRGLEDKTAEDFSLVQASKSLYLLYAAAAAALTYSMSKSYMDKNDPARQRIEALKTLANDQARLKGAPMLIGDIPLPGTRSTGKEKKAPELTGISPVKALPEKKESFDLPMQQQAVNALLDPSESEINALLAQQTH